MKSFAYNHPKGQGQGIIKGLGLVMFKGSLSRHVLRVLRKAYCICTWKQPFVYMFLDLAVAKSLQSTRTVTDDAAADDDV